MKVRPEDGSLEALYARTDGDTETIRELMKVMNTIYTMSREPTIRLLAWNAIRMSWLTKELPK
jgi:hypothetical protein